MPRRARCGFGARLRFSSPPLGPSPRRLAPHLARADRHRRRPGLAGTGCGRAGGLRWNLLRPNPVHRSGWQSTSGCSRCASASTREPLSIPGSIGVRRHPSPYCLLRCLDQARYGAGANDVHIGGARSQCSSKFVVSNHGADCHGEVAKALLDASQVLVKHAFELHFVELAELQLALLPLVVRVDGSRRMLRFYGNPLRCWRWLCENSIAARKRAPTLGRGGGLKHV